MAANITTLEDLLPLVAEAKTCKEFCWVVIQHAAWGHRRRLALGCRDHFGWSYNDGLVKYWVAPHSHSDERKQKLRASSDAWLAVPENKERRQRLGLAHRAIPEIKERNRVNATSHGRKAENRLELQISSCRKRSKQRGHSFTIEDETHLRTLWASAVVGKTPWAGLLDFGAFGLADEAGSGGHPFAPSFDRLDNNHGYHAGNVVVTPNLWNRTIKDFNRRLTVEAICKAGQPETPDFATLKSSRPHRTQIHTYIAGNSASVFWAHPALKPYQAEMLELTKQALFERGTCAVTGLAFVAEQGHPCMPSWDLIDQSKTGKRTYQGGGKAQRCISRENGTERPEDMRLVCQFFNYGRNSWQDSDWWRMAARVREIVNAGKIDTLLTAPF